MTGCWPLPAAPRILPSSGNPGSFWEHRGDRRHCGIDLYAPEGSEVASVAEGWVLVVGLFTTPEQVPYWNHTYHLLVCNHDRVLCRYAELRDAVVKAGQEVRAGQLIGHVGSVLNREKIDHRAPCYVQRLRQENRCSMLHLEVLDSLPPPRAPYRGGNWFGGEGDVPWRNPVLYLKNGSI